MSAIVVTAGLILIFLFDLPGGDDVGPGPMTKYKLITTHFQVSLPLNCPDTDSGSRCQPHPSMLHSIISWAIKA